MDRSVFTSRSEAENTTLHEALERFIAEYVPRYNNPKLETIKARALQRRKIASKFMAAIRSKGIADFMQERAAEGLAGNTIRIDLALISCVFNVAISSWGMESLRNPVSRVPKPKVSSGRTRRLEGDEEERLLAACSDSLRIVRFAIETAMRRNKMASLTWQNIDLEKSTAYLPKTKNNEERTVPLCCCANFEKYGKRIKPACISALRCFNYPGIYKTCQKVGIDGLTFHDLRH